MHSKLKNILIVLLISLGLVFVSSCALANPSEKYEELKTKLNVLVEEKNKCDNLSGQEMIDCADEVMKRMNEVMEELKNYEKEVGEKTEDLQEDKKSLENQIGYLNARVEKTEIEINITEQEINFISLDISKTEQEIKKTEENIKSTENEIKETKEKLADNIRKLYEYDNQNLVKLTLAEGSLSDFFDEIVYIENFQEEIEESLNQLKEDKRSLEEKKVGLEKQKESLKEKEQEVMLKIDGLNKTVADLDASKREKAVLLEITEGDEEKYQELLEKIKKETSALSANLNELLQARQKAIAEYLNQFSITDTCNASINVPFLAQTNSNWAGQEIGSSEITVGSYGCALTSVAMVFNYYKPGVTNPGIIASFPSCPGSNNGCGTECDDPNSVFTSGGCIYWNKVAQKYGFTIDPLSFGLNWEKINLEISRGHPVIIKTSSSAVPSHYVVIVGKDDTDYIVLDPYQAVLGDTAVGGCVYLNQSLVYAASNGNGSVDQMIIYHPQ